MSTAPALPKGYVNETYESVELHRNHEFVIYRHEAKGEPPWYTVIAPEYPKLDLLSKAAEYLPSGVEVEDMDRAGGWFYVDLT